MLKITVLTTLDVVVSKYGLSNNNGIQLESDRKMVLWPSSVFTPAYKDIRNVKIDFKKINRNMKGNIGAHFLMTHMNLLQQKLGYIPLPFSHTVFKTNFNIFYY